MSLQIIDAIAGPFFNNYSVILKGPNKQFQPKKSCIAHCSLVKLIFLGVSTSFSVKLQKKKVKTNKQLRKKRSSKELGFLIRDPS